MSTKTELELRPLQAHELDIVNGAGISVQTPDSYGVGLTGHVYPANFQNDLMRFGWFGEATTVNKPVEFLASANPYLHKLF